MTTERVRKYRDGLIRGVGIGLLSKNKDERGWLAEAYRNDDTPLIPAMSYVSLTHPGIARGPHEHVDQTDMFVFMKGHWIIRLWDAREGSETLGNMTTLEIKEPMKVLVPKGVVHAYYNASVFRDGLVVNFPDRLYKGHGRKERADEIRHESNKEFDMSDIVDPLMISRLAKKMIRFLLPACAKHSPI